MLDYQDMVCLAATQVWWTAEVENVFEKVKQVKLFLSLELNNV
jgi:dynein heavy chain